MPLVSHDSFSLVDFLLQEAPVGLQALHNKQFSQARHEFTERVEQWKRNHVNVAELVFEGIACGSVEEWCDREVKLALKITLLVILFHLDGHPFEVNDGVLGRMRVIRAVQSDVHHQLPIFI